MVEKELKSQSKPLNTFCKTIFVCKFVKKNQQSQTKYHNLFFSLRECVISETKYLIKGYCCITIFQYPVLSWLGHSKFYFKVLQLVTLQCFHIVLNLDFTLYQILLIVEIGRKCCWIVRKFQLFFSVSVKVSIEKDYLVLLEFSIARQ